AGGSNRLITFGWPASGHRQSGAGAVPRTASAPGPGSAAGEPGPHGDAPDTGDRGSGAVGWPAAGTAPAAAGHTSARASVRAAERMRGIVPEAAGAEAAEHRSVHDRIRRAQPEKPSFGISSSGLASSSMLTSLKVTTRTVLTNLAGRYMSQTQASCIRTSK